MDLYTDSQVSVPSAEAWKVDMSEFGGPSFVVFRTSCRDARIAVINHWLEIGFGLEQVEVESLVARAEVSRVAVIW